MSDATTEKPVKHPGPEHPITIEPNPSRVLVKVDGKVVADTRNALTLREAGYAPVQYVPLEDVDGSLITATAHATYCPYKGDASYYTITAGEDGENAVWEYREPYEAVAAIKGRVAFYANRVELTEEPAAD
ncbi:MAG TPA: DUF427 domain-containing protein [Solirubrobacteraceae bacterium]